ncbi:MAG: response regulator [Janthinobacterium lividum]
MIFPQASILVVDDEPVLRLTFRLLLQREGATVHVASNGAEALDVLRHETVHLILTDKQMPVMDGMTLLRTMAAQNLHVPAILFVNGAASEDLDELRHLSVVETITKPVHPADLLKVLARVLQPLPCV